MKVPALIPPEASGARSESARERERKRKGANIFLTMKSRLLLNAFSRGRAFRERTCGNSVTEASIHGSGSAPIFFPHGGNPGRTPIRRGWNPGYLEVTRIPERHKKIANMKSSFGPRRNGGIPSAERTFPGPETSRRSSPISRAGEKTYVSEVSRSGERASG